MFLGHMHGVSILHLSVLNGFVCVYIYFGNITYNTAITSHFIHTFLARDFVHNCPIPKQGKVLFVLRPSREVAEMWMEEDDLVLSFHCLHFKPGNTHTYLCIHTYVYTYVCVFTVLNQTNTYVYVMYMVTSNPLKLDVSAPFFFFFFWLGIGLAIVGNRIGLESNLTLIWSLALANTSLTQSWWFREPTEVKS